MADQNNRTGRTFRKRPAVSRICQQCGVSFSTWQSRVERGRGKFCSRQCGAKAQKTTHGLSASPTYTSWAAMIQRCTNPKHPKFPIYGARGITVDKAWLDFKKFLADMGERPDGTTIDRIDNDGHYCAANCRWTTPLRQQNNNSATRFVVYEGRPVAISDLARRLGIRKNTLAYRIDSGWPERDWKLTAWAGHRH